jgi:very-short-patch-repair endonuclease
MAAVLACGTHAVLSHESAAALWGLRGQRKQAIRSSRVQPAGEIHVSVPAQLYRRRHGIRLHRRSDLAATDRTRRDYVPVTTPARTLIDLATMLDRNRLEAAVNEADRLGLLDPETLRRMLAERPGLDGSPRLRSVLDRRTFTLTDSELERRFLSVAHRGGLPRPLTQHRVNGFRVDFYWPELRLVVETDGLRYHRTASQQSRDRVRDQRLVARGLIVLRFTHAQVAFDAESVVATLRAVMERQRPTLWTP